MGPMLGPEVRVATFSPTAGSSGEARRFVTGLLEDWALPDLVPNAALCVSEVASGIQVDEILRDLQLALLRAHRAEAPIEARLFDLEVVASEEALSAVGSLGQLLSSWSAQRTTLISHAEDAQIEAVRAWLADETVRQRAGQAPSSCPLPT